MKKIRKRLGKSGKKQRWAKRESCSSNPTTFKYRKAVTVQPGNIGNVNCISTLSLSSKVNSENDLSDSMDNLSVISGRFSLGATNSQLEKDAGAVFAAITEVIRSQNGKETITEYIAAMMTYLETVEDANELDASIYLISKLINRVPAAVLNKQFSKISSILMNIISKNTDSDNVLLLKNAVHSLAVVMQALDLNIWNNSIAVHIFTTILNFSIDSRAKVRKTAQAAVRRIIQTGIVKVQNVDSNQKYHPACDITAQFCLDQLSQFGASKDQSSTHHSLGLVRITLEFLPPQRVKSICESLLQLMTIGNTIVKTLCLQSLRFFLISRPKADTLPMSMTAKLITHLPFFFETAVNAFTCDSVEIHSVVTESLKGILTYVIEPVKDKLLVEGHVLKSVKKCFELLEGALRLHYHASWNQVLLVLSTFYDVCGSYAYSFTTDCLKTLATLCENEDFNCTNEAKYAIGAAVRSMGPHKVLQAVPLELETTRICFRHGWIISVLQQNIVHADFSYFVTHLIPLIEQIQQKTEIAAKNNQQTNEKILNDMEVQVWSLLPAFCTQPTNVVENFKLIAKLLGTVINTRPNLRLNVFSGIRTLINQDDDAINTELARFSKNFLPIFFNLYTNQSNEELVLGDRLAAYETLKVYLKITDRQIIQSLHEKLVMKLDDADLDAPTRHALLDLMLAFIPYMNFEQLQSTYNRLNEFIKSDDSTVRKKVFRFIEELCSCDSEPCKKFVISSLAELQTVLSATLSSAPPATKAVRLRCLKNLISRISGKKKHFITNLLPEIVLCIKEPSTKARTSALTLLTEIGNYFIKISTSGVKDGFKEFIQLIVAGFAGSVTMINASVLALANIIREFTERVQQDLQPLIDSACSLVQYPNRQVVDSALTLLKSILASFSEEDLFEYSEKMVACLGTMADDIKRPFRFKTKEVLIKLVKKFGYLRVLKVSLESMHGIIKKINKDLIREKRKKVDKESLKSEQMEICNEKKSKDDLMDLDDDDKSIEDEHEPDKSETNKLWLREKGEDVINFLDPSAFKNITATKHSSKVKPKNEVEGFRISADGKLIIVDDDEDVANEGQNSKTKSTKRKHEDDESMMSDVDISADEDDNSKIYQAGGCGIHRSAASGKGKSKPSKKLKKAGNKQSTTSNLQPYKYMPLGSLKHRKKTNNLDNIVRSAKKGSKTGRTKNARNKRKKIH